MIGFSSSPVLAGGRLEGNGTLIAPTLNVSGATVAPGFSAGQIDVTGNLSLGALAALSFDLGGTDRGVTYDAINVSGTVTVDGLLKVALMGGFIPTENTSFLVLDAGSAVSGSFANAGSGSRLNVDGAGSFLVSYGPGSVSPDQVILSHFAGVPEPGEWTLMGAVGLLVWTAVRRPRGIGQ